MKKKTKMVVMRVKKNQRIRGSRTDYAALWRMTEDEIEANARSDPDAPLMTEADLKRFKRVEKD